MNIEDYMRDFVEPTFIDFQQNMVSPRHAYLACVAITHVADRFDPDKKPRKMRDEWCESSSYFGIVDEVAQYFKHGVRNWVKKKQMDDPNALRITMFLGLEGGCLTPRDVMGLYPLVEEALKFVREKIADQENSDPS